ncbi:MAG TPA: tyrosine-type recombinase/integrase [Planctomycetaceae bacterium]|jgi:integrase|nr:tyrosine-type recombinase/integrase [Planctomycetaceae bacterium]
MSKAWVFQFKAHVEKYGPESASWYVGFHEPDGKRRNRSCGPGKRGKWAAEKLADRLHSQLVTGTYECTTRTTWQDFRKRYDEQMVSRMAPQTKETVGYILDHFERIVKPAKLSGITAQTMARYVAKRLAEKPRQEKSVSAATVNRELRSFKAALNVALEWELIARVPRIRMLKEFEKLPTFIPPDHFAAIYAACDVAKRPKRIPNVAPADWWRGLLMFGYMTGWRIGQILALKWADVDLKAKTALSRAEDNKGKRDCRIPLHDVVVEHLKRMEGGRLASGPSPRVFGWDANRRALWTDFAKIQEAAKLADGTPLPKEGKAARWYGFHDLRRGFATLNAGEMDLFQLQALMQHKSLATTQLYVNMANRLAGAVKGLYVPDVARKAAN